MLAFAASAVSVGLFALEGLMGLGMDCRHVPVIWSRKPAMAASPFGTMMTMLCFVAIGFGIGGVVMGGCG